MSELALAVFASESGAHLLDEPRSLRFDRFRRGFDAAAYLEGLARAGVRWVARGDPGFPARLRAIHDPPAGLFVRGDGGLGLLERACVAVVGARACSSYGTHVASMLARDLAAAGVVVVSGL